MKYIELAATAAIALQSMIVMYLRLGTSLSPDGVYYLSAARGTPTPAPYCYRWLLPSLMGGDVLVWRIAGLFAWLSCALGIYALSHSVIAVWLWCWLPIGSQCLRHPVLVDLHSIAFAIGSAVAWHSNQYALAFMLAAASSAIKEPGALFAACFANTPWLALCVLAHLPFRLSAYRDKRATGLEWLDDPIGAAMTKHDWLDWRTMLLPWGIVVPLAALAHASGFITIGAVCAVALAYFQLLFAQDQARLYQWAAPALVVPAAWALESLPQWLLGMCVLVHPFIVREKK